MARRRDEGAGARVGTSIWPDPGPVSESARDGTPTGRLLMQRRLLSADFKAVGQLKILPRPHIPALLPACSSNLGTLASAKLLIKEED